MTNMQQEKRKIIVTLLAYWPITGETKQDAQEAVAMFETALTGVSARFVEIGVKAFIQGRVATHNPSFRPKPSELASYVRPMQENENDHARAFKARQAQLGSSGREEPTEESKAAVQAKLDAFHKDVAQAISMDPVNVGNRGAARFPNAEETQAVLDKYYGTKTPTTNK